MSALSLEDAKERAHLVLGRVQATEIRLARVEVDAKPPVKQMAMVADTSLTLAAGCADDRIVCVSRYHVDATPNPDAPGFEANAEGESAPDEDRWSATVEIHGQWHMSSMQNLDGTHAQTFALAVGAMALHPYARSHIQSTVTATGYPPFTLDLLGSLLEPDDDGLIDLDIVSVLEI